MGELSSRLLAESELRTLSPEERAQLVPADLFTFGLFHELTDVEKARLGPERLAHLEQINRLRTSFQKPR